MTHFSKVEQESYNACIPIKDLKQVRDALYIFASGKTQGSSAAYSDDKRQYNEAGRHGMLDLNIAQDRFVDMMIWPKIEQWQKTKDHYYRCSIGFDYDGGRLFHKTSIEVLELDVKEKMYGLGVSAAYVGKEPEDGLAKYLNVAQSLYWTKSKVTGSSRVDSNQKVVFDLDFKVLAENLPFLSINAEQIVNQLASALSANPYETASANLFDDQYLKVDLSFDSLSFDRHYEHGWVTKGTILTLPVRKCQYADELKRFGEYRPPVFSIDIRNGQSKDLPIWRQTHKIAANDLNNQIYQILQAL